MTNSSEQYVAKQVFYNATCTALQSCKLQSSMTGPQYKFGLCLYSKQWSIANVGYSAMQIIISFIPTTESLSSGLSPESLHTPLQVNLSFFKSSLQLMIICLLLNKCPIPFEDHA